MYVRKRKKIFSLDPFATKVALVQTGISAVLGDFPPLGNPEGNTGKILIPGNPGH